MLFIKYFCLIGCEFKVISLLFLIILLRCISFRYFFKYFFIVYLILFINFVAIKNTHQLTKQASAI
jgi:hypothetical protein